MVLTCDRPEKTVHTARMHSACLFSLSLAPLDKWLFLQVANLLSSTKADTDIPGFYRLILRYLSTNIYRIESPRRGRSGFRLPDLSPNAKRCCVGTSLAQWYLQHTGILHYQAMGFALCLAESTGQICLAVQL